MSGCSLLLLYRITIESAESGMKDTGDIFICLFSQLEICLLQSETLYPSISTNEYRSIADAMLCHWIANTTAQFDAEPTNIENVATSRRNDTSEISPWSSCDSVARFSTSLRLLSSTSKDTMKTYPKAYVGDTYHCLDKSGDISR